MALILHKLINLGGLSMTIEIDIENPFTIEGQPDGEVQ